MSFPNFILKTDIFPSKKKKCVEHICGEIEWEDDGIVLKLRKKH